MKLGFFSSFMKNKELPLKRKRIVRNNFKMNYKILITQNPENRHLQILDSSRDIDIRHID